MSKKQTRRSISVRGVTYDRLREHCAGASLSMSDFVEQRIAEFFAGRPALVVAAPAAKPAPPRAALQAVRLPASSAIAVKKPQPTVAMKVSAPAVGRPAPTPASRVLKVRAAESEDRDDYRAIRF